MLLPTTSKNLCYLLPLTLALILIVLADVNPAKSSCGYVYYWCFTYSAPIALRPFALPSFGNDTWRDIIWALQTLKVGHVTKTDIRHIVSLLDGFVGVCLGVGDVRARRACQKRCDEQRKQIDLWYVPSGLYHCKRRHEENEGSLEAVEPARPPGEQKHDQR